MALTTALVVGTLATGAYTARQARSASDAQVRASGQAVDAMHDSESRALEMQRPFYEAGYAATAAMMDMAGLPRPGRSTAVDRASPGFDMRDLAGSGTVTRAIRAAVAANASTEGSDQADLSSYPKYNWQQDPGYQFRMDEGMRVLERGAAARGILNSGGTIRGAVRYGQNYASSEYQRVFDRVAAIAGRGQGAANAGSDVIVNTGVNTGRALVNAGDARASGYVAQGNAWLNAFNQFGMMAGAGMFGKVGAT
jgi:hypothetical protein